jgi:hypothetical protein
MAIRTHRRVFIRGAAGLLLAASGCGDVTQVKPTLPASPSDKGAASPSAADRLADPALRELHDRALQLVPRLRKLTRDKERERHIFHMIRIVEYAWAGLLQDQSAAAADIEQAEQYCAR